MKLKIIFTDGKKTTIKGDDLSFAFLAERFYVYDDEKQIASYLNVQSAVIKEQARDRVEYSITHNTLSPVEPFELDYKKIEHALTQAIKRVEGASEEQDAIVATFNARLDLLRARQSDQLKIALETPHFKPYTDFCNGLIVALNIMTEGDMPLIQDPLLTKFEAARPMPVPQQPTIEDKPRLQEPVQCVPEELPCDPMPVLDPRPLPTKKPRPGY